MHVSSWTATCVQRGEGSYGSLTSIHSWWWSASSLQTGDMYTRAMDVPTVTDSNLTSTEAMQWLLLCLFISHDRCYWEHLTQPEDYHAYSTLCSDSVVHFPVCTRVILVVVACKLMWQNEQAHWSPTVPALNCCCLERITPWAFSSAQWCCLIWEEQTHVWIQLCFWTHAHVDSFLVLVCGASAQSFFTPFSYTLCVCVCVCKLNNV
jgi:hypothetical protein